MMVLLRRSMTLVAEEREGRGGRMTLLQAWQKRADLTWPEVCLILVESLQWMAHNAVYFLGLIGAATYDLGGSAFLVAGITLVHNLTTSLGNATSGPVVDRFGPRLTAAWTLVASVVGALVVGFAPTSAPVLFFASAMLGLTGGFINTCTRAWPAYLTSGHDKLIRLNGQLVFYSNISFALGPVFGGIIVQHAPSRATFLFMAVSMAAAIPCALSAREKLRPERDDDEERGAAGQLLSGMAEGARITFADRTLRTIFVAGFLGFCAFGAFDSLESLYYRDVLGVSADWMGWLSAVAGFTGIVGAYVVGKFPPEKVNLRLLLVTLMCVGLSSMLYVGTPWLACACLGQAANGLCWGFFEPVEATLVQEAAPISHMGRIMGFQRFGLMMAGVIPLLVAPFLAQVVGPQAVLFGAACVIACVGAVFVLREKREQ